MKITTEYSGLRSGKCRSCGERTGIVAGDGRCPECIEELKFFDMTMRDDDEEPDDEDQDEEE